MVGDPLLTATDIRVGIVCCNTAERCIIRDTFPFAPAAIAALPRASFLITSHTTILDRCSSFPTLAQRMPAQTLSPAASASMRRQQ